MRLQIKTLREDAHAKGMERCRRSDPLAAQEFAGELLL